MGDKLDRWLQAVRTMSWLKVKWAILTYVAGDTPVVMNMELVSHPVLEFHGPSRSAVISRVNVTQHGQASAIRFRGPPDLRA